MADQALASVTYWITLIFAFFVGVLGAIDGGLRRLLGEAGVDGQMQTIIIVIITVMFIIGVLRAFGGLIRILLALFLILLVLHLLLPNLG